MTGQALYCSTSSLIIAGLLGVTYESIETSCHEAIVLRDSI